MYLINFGNAEIFNYMERMLNLIGDSAKLINECKKGASMYKDKFVSNVCFRQDEEANFLIEVKVKAEMRKNRIYLVSVTISSTNEILCISCNCANGAASAACKHAFAVLYGLEDYSQQKLYSAPTQTTNIISKEKFRCI